MASTKKKAVLLSLVLMTAGFSGLEAQPERWFKGNTHTHTPIPTEMSCRGGWFAGTRTTTTILSS